MHFFACDLSANSERRSDLRRELSARRVLRSSSNDGLSARRELRFSFLVRISFYSSRERYDLKCRLHGSSLGQRRHELRTPCEL